MGTASSTGSNPPSRMSGGDPFQTTYQSSYNNPGPPPHPNHGYSMYAGPGYTDRVTASHGAGQYYSDSGAYPPQRQSHVAQTAPPPVGFTSDVVYGSPNPPPYTYPQQTLPKEHVDIYSQEAFGMYEDTPNDCSRDVVLSRLLSAEEFLQHMEETDRRIQVMSEVTDRGSVFDQMTEALGLRGHLQDELLRIMAMLAADDPDLNCLNQFEGSYPKVVGKLRDLSNKAKALRALSKTRGASTFGASSDPSAMGIDPSLMRTIEEKLEEVDIVAAQAETYPVPGNPEELKVTEGDLKVKHKVELSLDEMFDAEEQQVSSNFASRVLDVGGQGPAAIDHLLQEHALSMQALRDRQNTERERVLNANIRRLTAQTGGTASQAGPTTSAAGTMTSMGTGPQAQTDNVQKIQKSYVAQINFGPGGNMTVVTPEDKAGKDRPVGTAAVIRGGGKGKADGSDQDVHKAGPTQDLDSDDDLDQLIAAAANAQTSENIDDEFDAVVVECDDKESEDLKSTFTKDMWEKRKNMTSEDFKAILFDFRSQEEERKRMRHAEKDKHKESMLKKLSKSKKNEKYSGEVSDEEVEPSNDKGPVSTNGAKKSGNADDYEAYLKESEKESEEARRIRGSEKLRMEQKLKEKLKNKKNTVEESIDDLAADIDETQETKDAAFVAELRRRGLTGEDIDELLRRHLQEAEQIRRRKFAERSRLDERLRDILGNKNKKDLEQMNDDVEEEMEDLDEQLARRLRADASPDDVDELLREHRRRKEELLRKQAAQKDRLQEQLKKKLREKQKGGLQEAGDMEPDEFFEKLQQLQKSGDLSQDIFQDMLRNYLSNVGGQQQNELVNQLQRQNELKEQRRRLRQEEKQRAADEAAAEQTASTLVTEHQEKTKQLQNTRQRERRALDARLQEKLKKGKMQKQAAEDDPNDF